MSTNLDVIAAFITLSSSNAKSNNLRYDSYQKTIHSYNYLIGYWLYVPNKSDFYAVICAHDYAPSRTTATHMRTLNVRSRRLRSLALPILTHALFEQLPDGNGEYGWDRSYLPLYRAAVIKAAQTKARVNFDAWKQRIMTITENLDNIATTFGWSYDRGLYTIENVLADNPKLIEQYALRDMGVWGWRK